MLRDKIKDLKKICNIVSKLKSQLIEELPHYGHDSLYLTNDEITTGILNNVTEIKLNLATADLVYFHKEQTYIVNLTSNDIFQKLKDIVTIYGLNIPMTPLLTNVKPEDLSEYLAFATKANKSLELFRMKLTGQFTQVHLWPHGFDFSVEWFTNRKDEQIGVGISPGHDQYEFPYLYVNPYPFNENMVNEELFIGRWHTTEWNGIKVEWKDLENKTEEIISRAIYDLYIIAKRNFKTS